MSTSINLSSHFEEFIHQQIASGRYNNVSEVIRAGLRALEEQEQVKKLEALRAAIAAGVNSEGRPADEVFARINKKIEQVAQGKQKS